MSIFETKKKYNDLDKFIDLVETLEAEMSKMDKKWNNHENKNIFEKYLVDVMNIGSFKIFEEMYLSDEDKTAENYLEFYYNSFRYWYSIAKNKRESYMLDLKKIFLACENISNAHNYTFVEIEKNKYQLLKTELGLSITNIKNKDFREQINNFYSTDDSKVKEGILQWFYGHLEKTNKKILNSEDSFIKKDKINELFKKLNSVFKHKDINSQTEEQKNLLDSYNALSTKEKINYMSNLMYLIIYSLNELQRIKGESES